MTFTQSSIIYYITEIMQILIFAVGCYFFSISIFGWIKRKEKSIHYSYSKHLFAVIIAAHNEEPVIKHAIQSLLNQNYPREFFDIFVIADNCTDSTAKISFQSGAIVLERENKIERGKGYALEWAFNKIFEMEKKYDAVCVFDADNLVSSNFLAQMNKRLSEGHKAIQGYIDSKNPFDSWITCSYSIAFWLSNRIFQLPRYYLGLSCSLCGTGFCITLDTLKTIGWGATCLTEDLEFTMRLALNNIKIAWADNAVVYDEKPLTLKQSWHQRKRWMQGHADCASKFVIPLFVKSLKEGNVIAFDCAIYLFQPIKFIFTGLITLMMWLQLVYPTIPFYNLKYVFPVEIWYLLLIFQFFYGPAIILAEKKLTPYVILGFIIYPFYCLTWLPITIHGFLTKDNKNWTHTVHTRQISINELEEA